MLKISVSIIFNSIGDNLAGAINNNPQVANAPNILAALNIEPQIED